MAIGALTIALTVLRYVPLVLKVISEATEAVEAVGGAKTGEVKKAALMEAVSAAFDLQEEAAPGTLGLDKAQFCALADRLCESALALQKAHGQMTGQAKQGNL